MRILFTVMVTEKFIKLSSVTWKPRKADSIVPVQT